MPPPRQQANNPPAPTAQRTKQQKNTLARTLGQGSKSFPSRSCPNSRFQQLGPIGWVGNHLLFLRISDLCIFGGFQKLVTSSNTDILKESVSLVLLRFIDRFVEYIT